MTDLSLIQSSSNKRGSVILAEPLFFERESIRTPLFIVEEAEFVFSKNFLGNGLQLFGGDV